VITDNQTKILLNQAIESAGDAINAHKVNRVEKEVQYSINVFLLLGIVLEGLINELGEDVIDSFTWKELEKSSTPLKWRIVSALKEGFLVSKEPMQTIIELQKIRNKIAHPKSLIVQNDIIISSQNSIKMNPEDRYELPKENFDIYVGYGVFISSEYNAKNSLINLQKVINAIKKIKLLFSEKKIFDWLDDSEKWIFRGKLNTPFRFKLNR